VKPITRKRVLLGEENPLAAPNEKIKRPPDRAAFEDVV
jgi:hypothetical protein